MEEGRIRMGIKMRRTGLEKISLTRRIGRQKLMGEISEAPIRIKRERRIAMVNARSST